MISESVKIFRNKSSAGVFVYSDDWLGWVHLLLDAVGMSVGWVGLDGRTSPRLSPCCSPWLRTHNAEHIIIHIHNFTRHAMMIINV